MDWPIEGEALGCHQHICMTEHGNEQRSPIAGAALVPTVVTYLDTTIIGAPEAVRAIAENGFVSGTDLFDPPSAPVTLCEQQCESGAAAPDVLAPSSIPAIRRCHRMC